MKSWGWYWNPVNQFQLFAVIKPAISLYAFMSVQQQMLCNKHAHTHSHTEERHKKKEKKKSFFHTGMQSECLLIIRDNMVNQTERWNVVILSLKDSATCVLSHIPTHTSMWLFRLKLMGVGGVGGRGGAVRSPPPTCAMIWKSIHVVKTAADEPGLSCIAAAMRHNTQEQTTQCFPSESCFAAFSLLTPGDWRWGTDDEEGRVGKQKKKKKFQTGTLGNTEIFHWWRIAWLSSHCRSRCLQTNHYRSNLRHCLGAVKGDGDNYDTLHYCTWQLQPTSHGNWIVSIESIKCKVSNNKTKMSLEITFTVL